MAAAWIGGLFNTPTSLWEVLGGGDGKGFSEIDATGEDAIASMSLDRRCSRLDLRGGNPTLYPRIGPGISCLGDMICSLDGAADASSN